MIEETNIENTEKEYNINNDWKFISIVQFGNNKLFIINSQCI